MDTDRLYFLGFSAFPGIGPMRFKLLVDYFGSAKRAWEASLSDLQNIGLGEKLSKKFTDFRRSFNLSAYAQKVRDAHISILTLADEKYPRLLKQIPDAPFLLYIKGKKRNPDEKWDIGRSIGVVGTRTITAYGREATRRIVTDLAHAGCTIVSGLAFGVDSMAHETAIEAGGKTIAVLGCGVDCCNPRSNQFLYDKIIDGHGIIISEFPLSQRASKGLFPARNRIISGLSLGVVVTEGARDSGALITASYAGEQGREVFAVPGPVNSEFSRAPNQLLKKGATLVESADDILESLDLGHGRWFQKGGKKLWGETKEEEKILSLLSAERLHLDEIIRQLGWTAERVASTLSVLEIKGRVNNEGGVYSLRS